MTPRPLFRWKSFWFGVFVIAFLGWAWVRSISHMENFSVSTPVGSVALASELGWVSIFLNPPIPGRPRFSYLHEAPYPGLYLSFESRLYELDGGFIGVSYRFLVVLFILPWSGWLAWRWCRSNRLDASGQL